MQSSWQAGLSVGFGSLSEEMRGGVATDCADLYCASAWNCSLPSDAQSLVQDPNFIGELHSSYSRIMTIFNIILGSSIVGGALSYFVESMIAENMEMRKALASTSKRQKTKEKFEKNQVGRKRKRQIQLQFVFVVFLA